MFNRSLALELARHGILVNAIFPGAIATEGTSRPLEGSGQSPAEARADLERFVAAKVPLGRIGTPDDVATVAVFLAAPASAYLTGAEIVVDGGALLT
jgi:NAD(P)-dependent dehydrogenase (short-subunit alcohol dehydrogenase family)